MNVDVCHQVIENVSRVVVGNRHALKLILVALLAEGHVLIEDVPGVGKTLLAKALAKSIGGTFKRVQFTPDLLLSDITGFNVYDQQTGGFNFQSGPVMTHVLLADEINRTVPRTQASMWESMEEQQITVDGKTFPLPRPFFVMATQNPIELEGIFPLPEAQLDRFLIKIDLGYPDFNEEMTILERFQSDNPLFQLKGITQPEQISDLQKNRQKIRVASPVREYIIRIAHAFEEMLEVAASMALQWHARGLAIGLMTNGKTLGDVPGVLSVGHGTHHLSAILETMARLEMKAQEKMEDTLVSGFGPTTGVSFAHFSLLRDKAVHDLESVYAFLKLSGAFFVCRPMDDAETDPDLLPSNYHYLSDIRIYDETTEDPI